jgi:glutaminase
MEAVTSPAATFVSTGHLPDVADIEAVVGATYEDVRLDTSGRNSQVYPALAQVDPTLFGICIAGVTGLTVEAGDVDRPFALMSVAKPFVFTLVCDALGFDAARDLVGLNATGRPFNSLAAVDTSVDGRTNPMVNAGAIATTSLTPGDDLVERWATLRRGLSRFAGRELELNDEVYESASATNLRNRAITALLVDRQRIAGDPADALDLYTRQSSLSVTARDLAIMGATLAGGGVNPTTRERVASAASCRVALAVMTTAGMYETSGDWLCDVGLPGKSGIGGGIVTVAPGKGGLGTYAPPLDAAGNSVKGQLVARRLSEALGLDIFASVPAVQTA